MANEYEYIIPCPQCGGEPLIAGELCTSCRVHNGYTATIVELCAKLEKATAPPHPLIALLTEALAVTDPEKPPTYAGVEAAIGTSLHWLTPSMVVLVRNPTGWRLLQELMPVRTTTDPAEARAWLATALAAT